MSILKDADFKLIIKTVLVFLCSSIIAVFLFAVGMYFLESGYEYSPLFANIAVAVGCFFAALYYGSVRQEKGIVIGLSIGGIAFILLTLITLLVNSGAVTVHILLRLVIFMLSSLIGAVLGVNKRKEPKYI